MRITSPAGGGRRCYRVLAGSVVAAVVASLLTVLPTPPAGASSKPSIKAAGAAVSQKGTLGMGYLLVATDGGIFNFGDSDFFGSMGGIPLNQPVVDAVTTPTGEGYWLVASDGGIFTFGDAGYFGSTGDRRLNSPVVGMDSTPLGLGYYLVASDGGIFTFGDAQFFGSAGGTRLNRPVVGMDATNDGFGYYLVASDGGIFTYGNTPQDTPFFGSTGNIVLNQPIVDMALTSSQQGYTLVASDGGIFNFGDSVYLGSTGDIVLNKPVVGMDVTPFSPLTAPDFGAEMSGSKEAPLAGDPDGAGFALFDFTADELCYVYVVNNLGAATAAHIHEAPAGVPGPVVVTLATPDANGFAQACMAVDPTLIADILANPANYYINVHTSDFPGGAVRGQLAGHGGVVATVDNSLVLFNTERPALSVEVAVTGIPATELIVGLDFRPKTGDLYALTLDGITGRLYLLTDGNPVVATRVGTQDLVIPATSIGFDFNPTVDRIRVVTDSNLNFRLHPDTGALVGGVEDTPLFYGPGDPNELSDPNVVGAAYTNNFDGATTTALFDIDSNLDILAAQTNPNGGVLQTVGNLGFDATDELGFDVAAGPAGEPGALITVSDNGVTTEVYAVNPTTGRAVGLGSVGSGATATAFALSDSALLRLQ